MAESTTITLPDVESFKRKALYWADNFRAVCLLDSNDYPGDKYRSKNWLLAVDAVDELIVAPHPNPSPKERGFDNVVRNVSPLPGRGEMSEGQRGEDFEQLKHFQYKANSPIFGFLSYDLKNQIENLESSHP